MKVCEGCGVDLVRRHQKKFCSNKCQRAAERRERTREWLETGGVDGTWGLSHKGHYVRVYLLEAQQGLCDICGSGIEWMGMPLAFVLDHMDGDPTNNARENLRLVCPNCDSQLPTFKARNRGNGRAWRRERYADGKSY